MDTKFGRKLKNKDYKYDFSTGMMPIVPIYPVR